MPNREDYVSMSLRQFVMERANEKCEYCLIHEDDTYIGCEIDHIISIKHGGKTEERNLAYACLPCNRHKGSDLGTLSERQEFTRFFNPRTDIWNEHFIIVGSNILPKTEIAEATIKILRFNSDSRVEERNSLQLIGRYPIES